MTTDYHPTNLSTPASPIGGIPSSPQQQSNLTSAPSKLLPSSNPTSPERMSSPPMKQHRHSLRTQPYPKNHHHSNHHPSEMIGPELEACSVSELSMEVSRGAQLRPETSSSPARNGHSRNSSIIVPNHHNCNNNSRSCTNHASTSTSHNVLSNADTMVITVNPNNHETTVNNSPLPLFPRSTSTSLSYRIALNNNHHDSDDKGT